MPRTASGESDQRKENEDARKALQAYLDDPAAVWSPRLRWCQRRLQKGWGVAARRLVQGMAGVVLRDHTGEDVTDRFLRFLLGFTLDDETKDGQPTGRSQDEAAEQMLDDHEPALANAGGSLLADATVVFDDRLLLWLVYQERATRTPTRLP